jgi:ADP-heptose:LPS heptosyltransferase
MNLVFQINGGLGKCIAATAVCSALKKKYPNDELIVISGYPEVFINNPNVKKTLSYNNLQYFYQDYIESKECKFFLHDPYLTTDYVKETKHLIQIWCELFDIPYHNEQPEFFLTQRELELYQRQVQVDKPIMMLQTNGGGDTNKKYSWARDIPTSVVLKVIEEFANKYAIFHIRREDQLGFQGTIQLTGQLRQILAISLLSQKRLVMDSFLQHALAALKLPSVACWIVNSPKVFGYELNTNIIANPYTTQPELRNSYLSKFNIGGDELEFPYNNETEIFNIDEIIQAINSENLNSEKNEIANNNTNIQPTSSATK